MHSEVTMTLDSKLFEVEHFPRGNLTTLDPVMYRIFTFTGQNTNRILANLSAVNLPQ